MEDVKDLVESSGGKWFVNPLMWSLVVPLDWIFAIPTLDAYMIAGLFTKNPFFHQLKKWQIAVIVALNLGLIIFVVMAIIMIIYLVCHNGLTGFAVRMASKLLSWLGLSTDVCGILDPNMLGGAAGAIKAK